MSDIELAKEALEKEGRTFAAVKDGKVISSVKRGVVPLLEMLDSAQSYAGWSCADKVAGKAPAMIYVLLGVKEVYARVMTREAMRILGSAGISFTYDIPADTIQNRQGTGMCPMEDTVSGIEDPEAAVPAIRARLAELQKAENNLED